MSDSAISAHARETYESGFAVRIELPCHVTLGDEPKVAGGAHLGPAPYELQLAALGGCTAMASRWCDRRMHWQLDHVEVDLTHPNISSREPSRPTDLFTKEVMALRSVPWTEQRKSSRPDRRQR